MSDKPNNIKTKDGVITPPAGQKTFDFSAEEQNFLQPRQMMINQKKLEIADIDFSMQQFIIRNVLTRLAIDPQEFAVSYNVTDNKITCTPKPPEILVPPQDIVIPGKPKN